MLMSSERLPQEIEACEGQISNIEQNEWNVSQIRTIQASHAQLDSLNYDDSSSDDQLKYASQLRGDIKEKTTELIEQNLGLIYFIANQFQGKLPYYNREDATNELISELAILMAESALRFNPDDGLAKFSTYFIACAMISVNDVNNQNSFKPFPNNRSIENGESRVQKLVDYYNNSNGYVGEEDALGLPTFIDLQSWMEGNNCGYNIKSTDITTIGTRLHLNSKLFDIDHTIRRTSLDGSYNYDSASPAEQLPDYDVNHDPETFTMRSMARDLVLEAMSCLSEREQFVLKLRFGIDSDNDLKTLKEIGEIIGVSVGGIRRIEAKAMDRLRRRYPSSRKLKNALELISDIDNRGGEVPPVRLSSIYNPNGPEKKEIIHRDKGVIFVRTPWFERLIVNVSGDMQTETDQQFHRRAGNYLAEKLQSSIKRTGQKVVFDVFGDERIIFRSAQTQNGSMDYIRQAIES